MGSKAVLYMATLTHNVLSVTANPLKLIQIRFALREPKQLNIEVLCGPSRRKCQHFTISTQKSSLKR
jgi:hypothetical protein